MLKWQHLFSSGILQRGREYYRENRVRSLIQDGEVYYAVVQGTEEYQVTVSTHGDRVTGMSCDCPYAQDGHACKHMAAALYEIAARELPLTPAQKRIRRAEPRTLIRPFEEEETDGEYAYFQPARFTRNLEIYSDVYEKAQRLLQKEEVEDFTLYEARTRDARDGKLLQATGIFRKNPYYPAAVTITRDRVTGSRCPIYGCKAYFSSYPDPEHMEICEHGLALLIKAVEEIRNHPHWDSTDPHAQRLMRHYFSRLRQGSGTEEADGTELPAGRTVSLEPRLEETEEGLSLRFRIGTEEKLYVLKNPELLVEAVSEGDEFPLGTRTCLYFSADRFGEKDQLWYEMIRQAVLEKQHHEEPYGRPEKKLQGIDLYGAQLDSFFELAVGSRLELKRSSGEKKLLEITDRKPELTLTIRKDVSEDGVFHGMILDGCLPRVLDGARYRYCLEEDQLCRMEADQLQSLEPLLDRSEGELLPMHIGRSYLTDFYRNIVPELAKSARILEPDQEEIAQYLPPEVSFRFWLDAEDGVPLCRPTADYGEEASYPLTDWLAQHSGSPAYRDQLRESAVLLRVRDFFPDLGENGELKALPDEDSVFRALTEGLDVLCSFGEVMSTARFDALKVRRGVRIQLGVSVDSGIMDLSIQSEDVTLQELAEILRSYRLKKKYHRLRNGDFIRMDESIGELAQLTDALRLGERELLRGELSVPAYRALYLEQMMEKTREIYARRDRHYRELIKNFNTVKDADFEVPEELEKVLRPYQNYGYKWLRTLSACGFGGILADEMGLGKTLEIISVLLAEKLEGKIGTSLVVCPASLVYNWEEEFHRFAPELSVCPVEGDQQERRDILARSGRWDVLISSYDHLKRDVEAYEDRIFLYQILDEAQFIKNQSTSAAKAVKVIRAQHRFALTGTPIENRLSDLWSIFDFLMPGFLYRYENFRNELEKPITKNADEAASARLRMMVSPFILRRLKTEVLTDLPEKVEEQQVVRFGEEQQKLYDAQVAHMKQMLREETDESYRKSKIRILAELTRIRQICCDPGLLFENYGGGSAKLEACMDLIRSAIEGEHRILLFSQFTSMLERIQERLREEGILFYEITGATPKKERLRLVSDFNVGSVPVFLISLRAGGTGLNLTGADIVIHYDPWWNAAAQNQATDRAHRIGQQKPVTVFKLLAKDSIEERIAQLQEKKPNLAEEIIGGEQLSFSELSREELLELIG